MPLCVNNWQTKAAEKSKIVPDFVLSNNDFFFTFDHSHLRANPAVSADPTVTN
jgi:hypothetical protein